MRVADTWSKHALLRVGILACLTFAYVWLSGPAPPLQADSIHDYSFVRLCAEGQGCLAHGTSIQGLQQGRLLLVMLAGLLRLGLSPQGHHLVFIALTVAGVVMLAELARALAGARAGLAVAGLAAWALPLAADHPLLWNPTLATAPLALLTVSCVQLARTEHPGWAAGIALGIVGAYHGHIVHLVAWPVACVLAGAVTQDPRARWVVVAGPSLGLLAFDAKVFIANLKTLSGSPLGIGVGAALILTIVTGVAVGAALRPRWLRLPERWRGVVALAWFGGAIFAAIGLGSLLGDQPLEARYVGAAIPALVVLAVTLPERVDPRAGLAASVLAGLLAAWQLGARLSEDRGWTYADVVTIDAALRDQAGVSLTQLGPWIRAPNGQELVNAARSFGPAAVGPTAHASTIQILALAGPRCAELRAFERWRCVELDWKLSAAWSRDDAPWIDPERFETCAIVDPEAEPTACVTVEVGDPKYTHSMGGPRFVQFEEVSADQSPKQWTQHLHIRATEGDSRLLLLTRGWRLRDSQDLEAAPGPVLGPRESIWLRVGSQREGILTLEADTHGAHVAPANPAVVGEFRPDEAGILELVAR
ncbi:hypothetical protein DB30_02669 [Enhygromyxa salina]|uniref:Uncharacterized protein n=1 Tax=Enhygromyxa salina TaxID=215803 RepID=A0A0C2A7C4_9BACT|nr:hypothetical protein [Enhygromyxa salina]KIG19388.1 hypothetical protein DB30_02669 [Enhygromyxa salina]